MVTKVGVKGVEDWSKVRIKQVYEYGGGGLLKSKYNGRLVDALSAMYLDKD